MRVRKCCLILSTASLFLSSPYAHTHTHTYTHRTHARTHAHRCTHTPARTHARTHGHTHAGTRTPTHTRTHARTHANTSVHARTQCQAVENFFSAQPRCLFRICVIEKVHNLRNWMVTGIADRLPVCNTPHFARVTVTMANRGSTFLFLHWRNWSSFGARLLRRSATLRNSMVDGTAYWRKAPTIPELPWPVCAS